MNINKEILDFFKSKNSVDYKIANEAIKEEMRQSRAKLHLLIALDTISAIKEILDKNDPETIFAKENLSLSIYKASYNETVADFVKKDTGTIYTNIGNDLDTIKYNLQLTTLNMYDFCGSINETSLTKKITINLNQNMDILYSIFLNKESLVSLNNSLLQEELQHNETPTRKMKV